MLCQNSVLKIICLVFYKEFVLYYNGCHNYENVFVPGCVNVCHVSAGAGGDQKALIPWKWSFRQL